MILLHKEMMILMVGRTSVRRSFSPEATVEVLRITMMADHPLTSEEEEDVVALVWVGVVEVEALHP